MYSFIDPLILLSTLKYLMTYASGEWIEIPAISSTHEDNYSKPSNLNNRPQYNKSYAFERIILKQSPTKVMEPMMTYTTTPTSKLSTKNDNLSSLQPTKISTSSSSSLPLPSQILSSTLSPPQISSSTSPTSQISNSPQSSTNKNENNRNEENSSSSFKGIPGLMFTTRMRDIIMGVHNTLSRQPSHTIRGKLKYLEQIKNSLLKNIWERSKSLWRGSNSIARSDSRSMSYFSSGEGPLITIALLTFAVFLIKIVQQFIQGLQGAAANSVGVQMPSAQGGRVKRWSDDRFQEATKMLHYMERFKIHNEL